jgi:dihydrofolate synthase/folylpolyglutamate synthase
MTVNTENSADLDKKYNDCLDAMYALGRFGIVLGLETIENILKNLGNPHRKFKTIHLAGTNGKGSIASTLSAVLCKAGYKTGLYTSPHLVSFNERICVNNEQISNVDVINAYEAVMKADCGERNATFFEISTAMAFHEFARQNCDFAIIETGMGGRLDATNIISPVLSIITNIALEHTAYLGDTIEKIAFEKAGIIKDNTPVISGASNPEAAKVISEIADNRQAELFRLNRDFSVTPAGENNRFNYTGIQKIMSDMRTPLEGDHQLDNAAIALAACEVLVKNKIADLTDTAVKEGFNSVKWAGRIEKVASDPLTIIDGAHNLAAIITLTDYLKKNFSDKKITLIAGILDDKSYDTMLKEILPVCSKVIFTKADSERSIDPVKLFSVAEAMGKNATIISSVKVAILHARKNSSIDDIVIIAGSLYVAGEAKAYFDSIGKAHLPAKSATV